MWLFRGFTGMLLQERQALVGAAIDIAPPGKYSVNTLKTTLRLLTGCSNDEAGTNGSPFQGAGLGIHLLCSLVNSRTLPRIHALVFNEKAN